MKNTALAILTTTVDGMNQFTNSHSVTVFVFSWLSRTRGLRSLSPLTPLCFNIILARESMGHYKLARISALSSCLLPELGR